MARCVGIIVLCVIVLGNIPSDKQSTALLGISKSVHMAKVTGAKASVTAVTHQVITVPGPPPFIQVTGGKIAVPEITNEEVLLANLD